MTIITCNLGSLILGLVACVLALVAMVSKNSYLLSVLSFSACSASLCLQFFEINLRVELNDWNALLDTSKVLAYVATILVGITIVFNVIALIKYYITR